MIDRPSHNGKTSHSLDNLKQGQFQPILPFLSHAQIGEAEKGRVAKIEVANIVETRYGCSGKVTGLAVVEEMQLRLAWLGIAFVGIGIIVTIGIIRGGVVTDQSGVEEVIWI